MRPIDADEIVFDYSGLAYISPYDGMAIAKYFADQIKAMPTITPPPNDPLTLEGLREMDGEPVWVEESSGGLPHWALVDFRVREGSRKVFGRSMLYLTQKGGTSISAEATLSVGDKVYRRKPKEV